MFQLLYVSSARSDLKAADVDAILATARERNAAASITGLLLEIEDAFLQVLEGDKVVIEALMAKIAGDPRHARVTRLLEREIPNRQFPDWSMGFLRPRGAELPEAGFEITKAALEGRLSAVSGDDIAVFIDTFCHVNARDLGLSSAA